MSDVGELDYFFTLSSDERSLEWLPIEVFV